MPLTSTQPNFCALAVEPNESGMRLDVFLVQHFPRLSRMLARKAIAGGGVRICDGDSFESNGKPSFRLKPGQIVQFALPEIPRNVPIPENIPLDILYEDEHLAVINKPADMVVHPSRGHWEGTLVSAIAYHFGRNLSGNRGSSRPGIVHRLDRDTTGAIIVAKNDFVHGKLAVLFEQRKIQKEYLAVVLGCPHLDRDMIDIPIGLHPRVKEKMRIAAPDDPEAKPAQTFFEVEKRYKKLSVIRCFPKTGRTHQIRVHLAHAGHPVLCDKMYGGGKWITAEEILNKMPFSLACTNPAATILLRRQALHAQRLTFVHPATEEELCITAPIPPDMQAVLDLLQKT
ncbi:MAG: RluA family pseudouridine synthase [Planctomycetaceae bacterium]|jgi:23S rRNA pseudouridine1911/1915/1917 synthase|nr:RluA family pseudouridine synthase [Planctomycetaceae bacterium]